MNNENVIISTDFASIEVDKVDKVVNVIAKEPLNGDHLNKITTELVRLTGIRALDIAVDYEIKIDHSQKKEIVR